MCYHFIMSILEEIGNGFLLVVALYLLATAAIFWGVAFGLFPWESWEQTVMFDDSVVMFVPGAVVGFVIGLGLIGALLIRGVKKIIS